MRIELELFQNPESWGNSLTQEEFAQLCKLMLKLPSDVMIRFNAAAYAVRHRLESQANRRYKRLSKFDRDMERYLRVLLAESIRESVPNYQTKTGINYQTKTGTNYQTNANFSKVTVSVMPVLPPDPPPIREPHYKRYKNYPPLSWDR
jgi:hypothetical protein